MTDFFPLANYPNGHFKAALHSCQVRSGDIILDVCAGSGDFLGLFLGGRSSVTRNFAIEVDSDLASTLCARFEDKVDVFVVDAFDESVDEVISSADWVLINPPFRSYRYCSPAQRESVRLLGYMPDLGASLIYRVLLQMKPDSKCLVVGKRIYFEGLGFARLQSLIDSHFTELFYVRDIGEIVGGSNKAKCALLVLQRKPHNSYSKENVSGPFPCFGDFAEVFAGPSTGCDRKFLNQGDDYLVRVPRQGSFVAGSENSVFSRIRWVPNEFKYRRSLHTQDRLGIAYGLIRNGFFTAVKPSWARFLSGTPCIFPKSGRSGSFALGLLALDGFRQLIGSRRHSMSLNPGDVRRVRILPQWHQNGDDICELGQQIRLYLSDIESGQSVSAFHSSLHRYLSDNLDFRKRQD